MDGLPVIGIQRSHMIGSAYLKDVLSYGENMNKNCFDYYSGIFDPWEAKSTQD